MAREPAGGLADPESGLAGARFLAQVALGSGGTDPAGPTRPGRELVEVLLAEGLEADEVLRVLPDLPVQPDTVDRVAVLLRP